MTTNAPTVQRILPGALSKPLAVPVIAAPMFIISHPALTIAQCRAGVIGAFPALNARPSAMLDDWLSQIAETLAAHDSAHPAHPAAPFAVNLIVHRSNDRLEQDLALCVKHRVPIVITSLGARADVNDAVHAYGGVTLHDVISDRFAHKAIEKGADGLVAVAAGAGGHAGTLSPFALIAEIRDWFDGPLALSGAIATGSAILAARVLGADFAYIGSAFIATAEANAAAGYKTMVTACSAEDIVYSNLFTGVHGNYLKPSIAASGLDPEALPQSDPTRMNFASGSENRPKAWKEIWGCGQGIGAVREIIPAAGLVERLALEYAAARTRISA
jgi:nitronate monooxygenase